MAEENICYLCNDTKSVLVMIGLNNGEPVFVRRDCSECVEKGKPMPCWKFEIPSVKERQHETT